MIRVRGFDSQWGLGIFLFSTMSRVAMGLNQPPIQWVLGGLFPCGVKRPERELTTHLHLVPRSNEWSFTSTPQYAFMVLCSVKTKHRDTFTFTYSLCINRIDDLKNPVHTQTLILLTT